MGRTFILNRVPGLAAPRAVAQSSVGRPSARWPPSSPVNVDTLV